MPKNNKRSSGAPRINDKAICSLKDCITRLRLVIECLKVRALNEMRSQIIVNLLSYIMERFYDKAK